MKASLLALALLLALAPLTATAQVPAASGNATVPEDLAALRKRHAETREALATNAAEAEAALQKWYHSALDALKNDAGAKGDLDSVLAIQTERDRVTRDLTPEEKGALPKLMRTVRNQYDQARAQRAAEQKARLAESLRTYAAVLNALEKSLTQKGDIDGAIAARAESTAVAEQLSAGATAVAAAPSVAAAAPATPAPANKPASALGTKPTARTVKVADDLKPYDAIRNPAPEAIPFESAPDPASPRPGRGLLLKNEPTTGHRGTTWSFFMFRVAPLGGVQIVHPLGDGQVIVHIRDEGVFVVSPAEMAKTPWTGGDPKRIRLTGDAEKVFPLNVVSRGYAVSSQLSGSGKYTLSINGKVIGRATLDAGPALVLSDEYKARKDPDGEEFPLKWGPGYAALIVAGNGGLTCRPATFQVSASIVAP